VDAATQAYLREMTHGYRDWRLGPEPIEGWRDLVARIGAGPRPDPNAPLETAMPGPPGRYPLKSQGMDLRMDADGVVRGTVRLYSEPRSIVFNPGAGTADPITGWAGIDGIIRRFAAQAQPGSRMKAISPAMSNRVQATSSPDRAARGAYDETVELLSGGFPESRMVSGGALPYQGREARWSAIEGKVITPGKKGAYDPDFVGNPLRTPWTRPRLRPDLEDWP